MKKAKFVVTSITAVAVASIVLAVKHKNPASYFSCDGIRCTVPHQLSGINSFSETRDAEHPYEIDDATFTYGADCNFQNCGTLYYGIGD
jgi:hypothetical protein